jgi:hypothetical protein
MRINAISFAYAARFVSSPKAPPPECAKGILFEPQKNGAVRLVATNGRCLIVVHDGAIQVEAARKTWIDPNAGGLLSAAKKGDFVTVRPDGIVEVEKRGAVIYVSPAPCERLDRVEDFPPYEQVIDTRLTPKTRNYALNTRYLYDFDLGQGVIAYPAGGNLDPLIVQPALDDHSAEIQSAIGVIAPLRSGKKSAFTLSEEYIKTFTNRE